MIRAAVSFGWVVLVAVEAHALALGERLVVRLIIGLTWAALLVWLMLPRSQKYRVLTPLLVMAMLVLTLLLWVPFR
ncbi:MAG: hypothetical protein V3T65_06965 [Acidobacteriota bacterium]